MPDRTADLVVHAGVVHTFDNAPDATAPFGVLGPGHAVSRIANRKS